MCNFDFLTSGVKMAMGSKMAPNSLLTSPKDMGNDPPQPSLHLLGLCKTGSDWKKHYRLLEDLNLLERDVGDERKDQV